MSKAKGFTLIELVIVIIILGILAVTAAPKFINLQKDARISTLQGLEGAIKGGASLVYSKAAIAGKETGTSSVAIGTGTVNIVSGYPDSANFAADLGNWLDISATSSATATDADWYVNDNEISPAGYANGSTCKAVYSQSTGDGESPTVAIVSDGC
ncbi:prepilin-type N-terminal cleavage/methylation domain-containing protein [Alginatibacterium sediminis]|uniref:Prepilin-type N-terminal cleavage/methylation domain-containing protein n=1 Tax=Alginatibacterium sediminis TaxID=2164068 RepID=A0A420ELS4_9ALTE|nr:prepilin-type N-terminal cleavage/methylation domain-containing protein [Alginatibacterium sediminis]RKF21566.1 prepilin-type N-terminal cleavage/methylation domain-containing protein [Alginatibacterium sediminis]